MFEDTNSSDFLGLSKVSSSSQMILNFLFILLISLVVINVSYYFFGIDIIGGIRRAIYNMTSVRQIEIDVVDRKPPMNNIAMNNSKLQQTNAMPVVNASVKEEVFNIPGNYYDYPNAKAVCGAYGARLAKYEEVEKAYQNGGEWCNYGWSEDQMALFPTQQKTYNELQKVPGHQHDCGRPGINGGYIANPSVRFGVNCYGNKPSITHQEQEYMDTISPIPQTPEEIAFQKQVDFWKTKTDEILVSPFNYDTWSKL